MLEGRIGVDQVYATSGGEWELSTAVVVPEQIYAAPTPPHREQGEAALMRAVLADALLCIQKFAFSPRRRGQRLFREAEDWILADEYRWPFSFVNVCAVLGLDADYIRRLVRQWEQKATPGHRPPLLRPSKLVTADHGTRPQKHAASRLRRHAVPARKPARVLAG